MPVSGEVMYSDEWMHRNAAGKLPAMFMRMCRDICKEHGLGNDRDIEMVWLTIKPEMKKIIAEVYTYAAQLHGLDSETDLEDRSFQNDIEEGVEEFINPPWPEYGN